MTLPLLRERTESDAWTRGTGAVAAAVLAGIGLLTVVMFEAGQSHGAPALPGVITLGVFAVAVWAWAATDLDDTYVALAATLTLVLTGVLPTERLFAALGDSTIWLLIGAFAMAAGVNRSGLALRGVAAVTAFARTPRQLVHLLTAALVVTAFAIPSTSGRAALAVPVFLALVRALGGSSGRERRLVTALALLFPSVILLSAVGSLIGAGAHLVTSQVLAATTGAGIGFLDWLRWGLPLAVVSSHLAAEVVLMMFTRRTDRRSRLRIDPATIQDADGPALTGPLSAAQRRCLVILAVAVVLWCTEPLHGIDPAVVALLGAIAASAPGFGTVEIGPALKGVPWSLLVFMAATLALGSALVSTGAAGWVAGVLFAPFGDGNPAFFLAAVVVLSTAMHLVIQSRTARSSVLVPIVIVIAPVAGVSPVAAAFASTAAAGFCHTLSSSAKPVAVFARLADTDDVATYGRTELLRLSAVLAPLHVATVLVFALALWPHLGLPFAA